MLPEQKYCRRCAASLGYLETSDYYSYIRKKYCDKCAVEVKKEKTAQRVAALRLRKKTEKKELLEQIKRLEIENKKLRNIVNITADHLQEDQPLSS